VRREQRQLLSEEVRQQLATEITDGTYAPNEKLPSEPDFAKRYGISRPTLREILSGLERDGLVERRPHATHGRILELFPTDEGVRQVRATYPLVTALEDRIAASRLPDALLALGRARASPGRTAKAGSASACSTR